MCLILSLVSTLCLVLSGTCLPADSYGKLQAVSKPAFFLLAGDSTTAVQNAGKTGGGWGDGFLNYTLKAPADGINYGHNGATTKSFVDGGDWSRVLGNITSHKDEYNVFVTIQFGHNDQKSTSGVSTTQYFTNLKDLASEVQTYGATPILVTPLTRRSFDDSTPPVVVESLSNERNLTLQAATETDSRAIDLNEASEQYCNSIGEEACQEYNLTPTDNTHLNLHGSEVFGRMVSGLMQKWDDIEEWTTPNATLSEEIQEGVPAR